MNLATTKRSEPSQALALLPALLVAGFGFGVGATAFHAPPAMGETAVVFAPWVGEGEALAAIIRAGGSLAGTTRLGNVTVAFAPDAGFADRIRAEGALLTLAAAVLCGTLPPTDGSSR